MPGVNVPGRTPSPLQTIVPMAGAVVGSIYGGPVGGMAGAKIGQGLVGGGPGPSAVKSAEPESSAIDRRIDTMQNDPSQQLAQAETALKQMPPEYQDAYGPTIMKARQLDQQGGM